MCLLLDTKHLQTSYFKEKLSNYLLLLWLCVLWCANMEKQKIPSFDDVTRLSLFITELGFYLDHIAARTQNFSPFEKKKKKDFFSSSSKWNFVHDLNETGSERKWTRKSAWNNTNSELSKFLAYTLTRYKTKIWPKGNWYYISLYM